MMFFRSLRTWRAPPGGTPWFFNVVIII